MKKNFTRLDTKSIFWNPKLIGLLLFLLVFDWQDADAQVITSLNPTCATEGQAVTLTINGSDFRTGAGNVRVEALTPGTNTIVASTITTANNENQIIVIIPSTSEFVSTARTVDLRVSNRSGNSDNFNQNSNRIPFTIYPVPAAAGVISGPTELCSSVQTTYSVAPIAGAVSYRWTLPTGTIITAENLNIITVNFTIATSGSISVVGINGCGRLGQSSSTSIEIRPSTTENRNLIVTPNEATDSWTVEAVDEELEESQTYNWFTRASGETEWQPYPSTSTNTITIPNPSADLEVRAVAVIEEGCIIYDFETLINPLPVELIYFTAVKRGNDVAMEWATASELDNKGFEVQVSTDAKNFRSLGFVDSKVGTTSLKQAYTFVDRENGKIGTRYYRLKQIDLDGRFEYFSTQAVEFGTVTANSIKVYPNPFQSEVELSIQTEATGDVHVTVTNTMGQQLMQHTIRVERGANSEKLKLDSALPRGIYIMTTLMGDSTSQFKLLKQ